MTIKKSVINHIIYLKSFLYFDNIVRMCSVSFKVHNKAQSNRIRKVQGK